jgi:hypothetical protein
MRVLCSHVSLTEKGISMKEKIIKVTTKNKMLFIKGKLSRTPLEAILKSEEEITLLKSSMIHQGIEFTVEDYVKPIPKKKQIKKIVSKKKTTTKKKVSEPKTILEKISTESDE